MTAQVVSAAALSENQISKLTNLLSEKIGERVEIISNTDPSLIGGLYIHVNGQIINCTVKKQINDMKVQLAMND